MCKYQLLNHLTEFFNTSIFPSKDTWKRIVKKSVFDFEESKWQAQILSSSDICHFLKFHPNLKMHRAWHISRLNPLLIEQAHHVISICASWRSMSCEGVCSLYHSKYSDLLIHVISNCQYVFQTRVNQALYTFPEIFRHYTYCLVLHIDCNIYMYICIT